LLIDKEFHFQSAIQDLKTKGHTLVRVRIIVGVALFIMICGAFWLDAFWKTSFLLIVLVGITATLSLHELYGMAEQRGLKPFKWLGLATGIALVATTHWWGWTNDAYLHSWRLGVFLAGLVCACFLAQALRPTLAGTATNIAVTVLGFLYVPFLLCFFIGIDHLRNGGAGAVLFVIFVAKAGDIGGYSIGLLFGGPKLAPVVSPNKTTAGAIGGLVLSVLVGILTSWLLDVKLSPLGALAGSVLVGISAQLGDLCESMIKRDLEVKDAGRKLPGYGGVLDLMDCLITAGPVGYLFFHLLGTR
jgi:phosphatidate cytidylyltransferase